MICSNLVKMGPFLKPSSRPARNANSPCPFGPKGHKSAFAPRCSRCLPRGGHRKYPPPPIANCPFCRTGPWLLSVQKEGSCPSLYSGVPMCGWGHGVTRALLPKMGPGSPLGTSWVQALRFIQSSTMSVNPFSGILAIIYQKKIKPITISAKPKPLVGSKIPFDPDEERLVEDGKVGGLLVKAKALFG